MNWLSTYTDRRRAGASVVLGWVLVLIALASCCLPASERSASAHHGPAPAAAPRITLAAQVPAVVAVVADAPGNRWPGSSCHGASEHSAPVVLPDRPAPASLPSAAAVPASAPLTGAATIRGPSNDAVRDVDHLRLQVQRI
ncbi:hypothetical protein ACIBI8_17385 [Streptomyces sp. NPDC050529]|uniref:hypothetical protein n=1 Tax=Streptomyces sp. NPDC050529 TaxID=3365624 RepID=UPI003797EC17